MLKIFLLLPLATLFQEGECSEKKSEYEEIKRGKCPKPQKKKNKRERKSETRGKKRQVSDSRIRGTRYPPERKEKIKYRASHSPQKPQVQGRYVPPQKSKSSIRLSLLFSPLSPFIRHTCTSWFDLLTCSSGSMV